MMATFQSAKTYHDKSAEHQILEEATWELDTAARDLKYTGEELVLSQEELILKNCLLLACDGQLTARTGNWQNEENGQPVSLEDLEAFQNDLNSLKRVSSNLNWARPRIYLHEATLRLMAGAAPNRTQKLLDQSLIQRSSSRGLICGKGTPRKKCFENEVLTFLFFFFADEKMVITGEKEHAIALYMACRHLPSQLLCSPGERAGMLAEEPPLFSIERRVVLRDGAEDPVAS